MVKRICSFSGAKKLGFLVQTGFGQICQRDESALNPFANAGVKKSLRVDGCRQVRKMLRVREIDDFRVGRHARHEREEHGAQQR